MAMTLSQFAMIEKKPLNQAVMMGLLEYSWLMDIVPFTNQKELSAMITRWKTLPTSWDFRDLNEAFGEGTGDYEQVQEGLYDAGTDIDVDLILTKVKNTIVDPRANQTKMHLKALSYIFNDQFLNADRAANPKGFDGIKVRAADLVTADPELQIDAAGLDISESTGRSEYDTHLFLDYCHRLIYRLDGDSGNNKSRIMLLNDRIKLAFISMFRRSSLLSTTKDNFERRDIDTFMGLPMIDMGWKGDQVTRVLPLNFDDTTQSGVNNRCSIYFVALGEGEAFHGVQLSPLQTRDIGELQSKPVLRTRLQWTYGLANWSRRGAARLKGLYAG